MLIWLLCELISVVATLLPRSLRSLSRRYAPISSSFAWSGRGYAPCRNHPLVRYAHTSRFARCKLNGRFAPELCSVRYAHYERVQERSSRSCYARLLFPLQSNCLAAVAGILPGTPSRRKGSTSWAPPLLAPLLRNGGGWGGATLLYDLLRRLFAPEHSFTRRFAPHSGVFCRSLSLVVASLLHVHYSRLIGSFFAS